MLRCTERAAHELPLVQGKAYLMRRVGFAVDSIRQKAAIFSLSRLLPHPRTLNRFSQYRSFIVSIHSRDQEAKDGAVSKPTTTRTEQEVDAVKGDNDEMQLTLTKSAVERLKKLNRIMRLQVDSGGCSGFQYHFSLIGKDDIGETDRISHFEGCGVVIDEMSLELLSECVIDYSEELICSSFTVKQNKIAKTSCGCGNSFDIDFSK